MGDDTPPAALLTKAQRQWLRGEKEYSPSAERDLRARIRERVQTSLAVDVPILAEHLDPSERKQIAQSFGPNDLDHLANSLDDGAFGGHELAVALRSQVAFVYHLARDGGLDAERVIEDGISEAERSRADVLLKRFREDPESLTLGELQHLRETGSLPREEYREAIGEVLDRPIESVGFGKPPLLSSEDPLPERLEAFLEEQDQVREAKVLPDGERREMDEGEEDISMLSILVKPAQDIDDRKDFSEKLRQMISEQFPNTEPGTIRLIDSFPGGSDSST